MPKLKTHKSSAKRFKITASGRVMALKSNRRHNLEKKSPKRKRRLRKYTELSYADSKRVHKLLPYG
jgi:ribosomal protein L35